MPKEIDKIVMDAMALQVDELTVGEICMLVAGLAESLSKFSEYVKGHAGEKTAGVAVSLVSESLLDFILAEKELRTAISENLDELMASISPSSGQERYDFLADILEGLIKGKNNKNNTRS